MMACMCRMLNVLTSACLSTLQLSLSLSPALQSSPLLSPSLCVCVCALELVYGDIDHSHQYSCGGLR